jgi:hypothetical protein
MKIYFALPFIKNISLMVKGFENYFSEYLQNYYLLCLPEL